MQVTKTSLGHSVHPWINYNVQKSSAPNLSRIVTKFMWSVGQAENQRGKGQLIEEGIKKFLLIKTVSLPMSLTLTEKKRQSKGDIKNDQRE